MENVKYILIVSQYYYSYHCFVVSAAFLIFYSTFGDTFPALMRLGSKPNGDKLVMKRRVKAK